MFGRINGTGTLSAEVIKGPGLSWPTADQFDQMTDRAALLEWASRRGIAFSPTTPIDKIRAKLKGLK